ncbi:MAG: HD domain-containing protein [Myxococcota bacterium]|nr:HD domain-containing protein [Myxococcota bacterium]
MTTDHSPSSTDPTWNADLYNQTLRYAAMAHHGQTVPGTQLPYLMHIAQVCQEALGAVLMDATLDGDIVMQCALLHDTIEDTDVTHQQLADTFGSTVAGGVLALTKFDTQDGQVISKSEQMADSLRRIQAQPREIAVVKMADRITNMQTPPAHWSLDKRRGYHDEAQRIHDALKACSKHLERRLRAKLDAYVQYL